MRIFLARSDFFLLFPQGTSRDNSNEGVKALAKELKVSVDFSHGARIVSLPSRGTYLRYRASSSDSFLNVLQRAYVKGKLDSILSGEGKMYSGFLFKPESGSVIDRGALNSLQDHPDFLVPSSGILVFSSLPLDKAKRVAVQEYNKRVGDDTSEIKSLQACGVFVLRFV